MPEKIYLGDGVYAEYDGYYIRLTAEDGINVQAVIYLEDTTAAALKNYIKECFGL